MTEDSRKSNQHDFFVFVELIRAFTSDRQSLPENAHDGEIFPRICDDKWVAESVALCGLKIAAVIAAVWLPVITVSCHCEFHRFRQRNPAQVSLVESGS